MVNYTNSKVYKIWSTQGDMIYVGSTTKQYLSQRMDKHRTDYKCWKDNKSSFITSFKLFDLYGLENCFIELIEAKECNTKDELKQIEGKYIRELVCVNKRVEGRTKKEWREENKETIKQHYQDNKNQLLQYQKEYFESNKEKVLEQQKLYKNNNKDKINQRKIRKYECECGGKYNHDNKSTHQKTIKHCQFIESQTIKPEDGAE